MKHTLDVKYKLDTKFYSSDREYVLIGYEYVPSRAIRYILVTMDDFEVKWLYFYEKEIELMLSTEK